MFVQWDLGSVAERSHWGRYTPSVLLAAAAGFVGNLWFCYAPCAPIWKRERMPSLYQRDSFLESFLVCGQLWVSREQDLPPGAAPAMPRELAQCWQQQGWNGATAGPAPGLGSSLTSLTVGSYSCVHLQNKQTHIHTKNPCLFIFKSHYSSKCFLF